MDDRVRGAGPRLGPLLKEAPLPLLLRRLPARFLLVLMTMVVVVAAVVVAGDTNNNTNNSNINNNNAKRRVRCFSAA